ncbi:MAG: Ig-like domain-containing protein [Clostridia bacterium]|nr:Ig-like domain-containing protein [Clostridia bacterium]
MKGTKIKGLKNRILAGVLLVIMLALTVLPLMPVKARAVGAVTSPKGEALEIDNAFASHRAQATKRVADAGYVGEVQYTVYYNKSKGTVQTGYKSKNPVVIYAVNTRMERVGTDTNTEIVGDMLNKGYVVVVLDYLNSEKAVSPALDFSSQYFRTEIASGTYMPDNVNGFPDITPTYSAMNYPFPENFLVPSGCNLIYADVFWEIDKHSADGTLEMIVNSWNTDFRGKHPNRLVKWATGSTTSTRKTVEKAFDGTTPQWYNANGGADANGLYTKVKWTLAKRIEDCVNPDGTPIDLNMYIHTVYPTNPAKEVPVVSLANSSNFPTTMKTSADPRAQFNGFLFNGYANAVFDYLWHPMAHNSSFGYYDGNRNNNNSLTTVTNDHMNYSIHIYNDKLVNTAAMRYLRYLSLSGGSEYNFDIDKFGVIGNSKGGWFTFLGERVLQSNLADTALTGDALKNAIDLRLASFTPKRYFEGHHGETRYQAGKTAKTTVNGMTVDGGERQPWIVYDGKEILSGCQLVYASNGSQEEDFSAGHVPTFVALHMYDDYNAAFGSANMFQNLCREHDVPSMVFEVPLGHMLAYGIDMDHNVDTYLAQFDFADYHLRGAAVKVLYTTPRSGDGGISTDAGITIKFTGPVPESEITKVSVVGSDGAALSGSWSALYGKTEWTFTPSSLMKGGEAYTITVPKGLKGDNGRGMETLYTAGFYTAGEASIAPKRVTDNYIILSVPQNKPDGENYMLRFYIENDAANTASVLAVDKVGDVSGTELGTVSLKGAGHYSIDVSDYLKNKAGKDVIFLISPTRDEGENTVYKADFTSGYSGVKASSYTKLALEDGKLKAVVGNNEGKYYHDDTFYDACTGILSVSTLINSGAKITDADYGRRFTISFKVYDEVSRVLQLKMNYCSSSTERLIDYDRFLKNVYTKAGEWVEYSFEYEVYETKYGAFGDKVKSFSIAGASTGDTELPFYIDDLTVTETVTDITVGTAALTVGTNSGYVVKETSGKFDVVSGSTAKSSGLSLGSAMYALDASSKLVLRGNYTVGQDDTPNLVTLNNNTFEIDLGGYTLTSRSLSPFVITANGDNSKDITIKIKNGRIVLEDKSLISIAASVNTTAKNYSITLEGVTFEVVGRARVTGLLMDVNSAKSATANVKFTVNNCIFDIPEERFTGNYLAIFPVAMATVDKKYVPVADPAVKATYTVSGGRLMLTKAKLVRICEDPAVIKLTKNSDGNYTTLTLPNSRSFTPTNDASFTLGVGDATFVKYKTEGGISYYTPIDDRLIDPATNPFLVFDEKGGLLGAKSQLMSNRTTDNPSAIDLAKGYLKDNVYDAEGKTYGDGAKVAYIVMRRDYTMSEGDIYDNLAQIQNKVVIDLGGYTLTSRTGETQIFANEAKPWSGSGDALIFPSTIEISNGVLDVRCDRVMQLSAWEANANGTVADKLTTYIYKNIDFKFSNNTSKFVHLVTRASEAGRTTFDFTFDNCSFDITSPTSFTLFNRENGDLTVNYKMLGSDIRVADTAKLTVDGGGTVGSVVFGVSSFGRSSTLDTLKASDAPDANKSYTLTGGGSSAFTASSLGVFTLCAHSYTDACDSKCNVCGFVRTAGGEHSFTHLAVDENGHYYECACGERTASEAHTGGSATCQHEAVCEVCYEAYGSLGEHAWGEWQTNDETHNRKCTVCRQSEGATAHSYTYEVTVYPTATTEGERVGTCVCGHTVTETVEVLEEEGRSVPLGLIIGLSAGGAVLVGGGVTLTVILIKRKRRLG